MLGKHLWADMNAPLTTTTYSTQGCFNPSSSADVVSAVLPAQVHSPLRAVGVLSSQRRW